MSKLKSAGTALNIAENAKISESALKMTEYLWELNLEWQNDIKSIAKIIRVDDFCKWWWNPCKWRLLMIMSSCFILVVSAQIAASIFDFSIGVIEVLQLFRTIFLWTLPTWIDISVCNFIYIIKCLRNFDSATRILEISDNIACFFKCLSLHECWSQPKSVFCS